MQSVKESTTPIHNRATNVFYFLLILRQISKTIYFRVILTFTDKNKSFFFLIVIRR